MCPSQKFHTLSFLQPDGDFQRLIRDRLAEPEPHPEDVRLRLHQFTFRGSARPVPIKVFAAPDRLSRDEYLSLPRIFAYADGKRYYGASGAAGSDLGVKWGMLAAVMLEVDKNEVLQKYDCGQE
jgi:hypothetical protein